MRSTQDWIQEGCGRRRSGERSNRTGRDMDSPWEDRVTPVVQGFRRFCRRSEEGPELAAFIRRRTARMSHNQGLTPLPFRDSCVVDPANSNNVGSCSAFVMLDDPSLCDLCSSRARPERFGNKYPDLSMSGIQGKGKGRWILQDPPAYAIVGLFFRGVRG